MISPPHHSNRGFAIPMTILAIGGLSLLLVGLLTILTLERRTARSYSDAARAEFAVESGLAVALASLTEIAGRDDSLVFRIDDPVEPTIPAPDRTTGSRDQFFTFGAVYENDAWRGIPLFSGADFFSPGNRAITTNSSSPVLNELNDFLADTPIPLTTPDPYEHAVPRAQWVEMPGEPDDKKTLHFAWWVEDLGGRIDGKLAGSEPRADGESAAEIPLFTLFGDAPVEIADTLVTNRDTFPTIGSTRSLLSPEQSEVFEPSIHYGFPTIEAGTPIPPRMIPHGFGYADAGTPAIDLNDLVSRAVSGGAAAVVDEMATHIRRNLPDFDSTRRGGFPTSDDYIATLCASAIDYADADSNPTSGTGYRGIDSYPFVNQITDRYLVLPPPPTNPGLIRLQCRTFVELWNPSNQTIQGRIQLENINNVGITAGGPRMMSNRRLRTTSVIIQPPIQPNEHRVLELFTSGTNPVVYDWTSNVVTVPPYVAIGSTTNNYELYWNNFLVDKARMAIQFERAQGSPSIRAEQNNAYASGNCPELEPTQGVPGDPRSTWYLTRRVRTLNYEQNTCWGGRNLLRNINKPMLVSPDPAYPGIPGWPDSGSNSPFGQNPGSRANVPRVDGIVNATTGAVVRQYEPNRPEMAPFRISNLGYYNSTAELGNIFDPAQWTDVNVQNSPANPQAGGGITLAIGRPEYQKFDIEGRRAAQLLDLFDAIRPASLPTVTPSRRININTASRETLRALMADVVLAADPATPGVEPPRDTLIGDLFADAVIHSRTQAALRGPSDLNAIRVPATNQHFFGNREVYPASERPPESWNDAGREELFSKVLDLVTFGSKTFRIVVAGQVRDQRGRAMATTRGEYHVEIEPARNADGTIDPGQPPVLRKLYVIKP